jgi:hypothetical protein
LNWSGVLAYMPDFYDPVAGLMPAGNLTESGHLPRLSRHTNRTPVETLAGPTFGTAVEAYGTISGLTDGSRDFHQKDIHRARMLMPLQNLFYLRRVINALEGEAGEAIGAEGATRGTFINRVGAVEPVTEQ